MSLKVLLLVSLLMTVTFAQDLVDLGDTDASNITGITQEAIDVQRVQANFDAALSEASRANNFFCLDRMSYFNETSQRVSINYTQFEQNSASVWTLYVQMPILGYLDVTRKRALIDIVVQTLNGGAATPVLEPTSLTDVCIGTYEIYGISTFSESILIHLYGSGSTTYNSQQLAGRFETNVVAAYNDGNNNMVIGYPGQSGVITFNLAASSQFGDNVLYSGDTSSDGAVPINLAVFLGSYANNVTFGTPIDGVSESFGERSFRSRAENPNPINYGLEAGDIVFAIIGSILLLIVGFLTILGFCIHPFFLA